MRQGWMRKTSRYGTVALAALLAVSLFAGLGCQKRVVSTQNDWVGSQYGRLERENLIEKQNRREEEPGMFDQMGEAMFGWTDVFSGEEEPEKFEFGYTGSKTPGGQGGEERTVQRSSGNTGIEVP